MIKPDLYQPQLNPVYAALLGHYSAVADPCRVRDPDRKGTMENAIQHTQGTALKGRKFESIDEQNTWLAHWEGAGQPRASTGARNARCWRCSRKKGRI